MLAVVLAYPIKQTNLRTGDRELSTRRNHPSLYCPGQTLVHLGDNLVPSVRQLEIRSRRRRFLSCFSGLVCPLYTCHAEDHGQTRGRVVFLYTSNDGSLGLTKFALVPDRSVSAHTTLGGWVDDDDVPIFELRYDLTPVPLLVIQSWLGLDLSRQFPQN